MLSVVGETSCVCSNCFTRPYKLYDTRNMGPRKRTSASDRGSAYFSHHPTLAEDIHSTQLMWIRYLRRTKRKEKSAKSALARQRKTPGPTEEEIKYVNEMRRSDIFWESPTRVDKRVQVKDVTPENFWAFIYQNTWKGRIRVCEGELMYRITETLNTLVREKVIGNFNVSRFFTAEGIDDTFGKDEIPAYKVTRYLVRTRLI